jgi:hypothetical protein
VGRVDPALEIRLRVEVVRVVTAAGRRRTILPVCHVGHPAGEQSALPESQVAENTADATAAAALRTDLVVRALDGLLSTTGACTWVVRSGPLTPTDADAAWWSAARSGFARHDVPLEHVVLVNRSGWRDLVGGESRSWSRVRPLTA